MIPPTFRPLVLLAALLLPAAVAAGPKSRSAPKPKPAPTRKPAPPQKDLRPAAVTPLSGDDRPQLVLNTAHAGGARSLAWSPDGAVLAVGGNDGAISLHPAGDEENTRMLYGHAGPVHSVAWSRDGRSLASVDEEGLRIWDAAAGRLRHAISGAVSTTRPGVGHSYLRWVEWLPDGKHVVTGGMIHGLQVWSAADGRFIRNVGGRAQHFSISPDGRLAVICHFLNPAVVDLRTGKTAYEIDTGGRFTASRACWSPDGRLLAVTAKSRILIVDAATRKTVRSIAGHGETPKALVWSVDGARLATGAQDKTARIWDARTGDELKMLPHTSEVGALSWSRSGTLASSAAPLWVNRSSSAASTPVHLWSAAGEPLGRLAGSGQAQSADRVEWSPDGTQLAVLCGDGSRVRIWDALTGRTRRVFRHSYLGSFVQLAWSPDGRWLSAFGGPQVIDLATGEMTRAPVDTITQQAVWSPDGRTLALGVLGPLQNSSLGRQHSRNGSILLYDPAAKRVVRRLSGYTLGRLFWSGNRLLEVNGTTLRTWNLSTDEVSTWKVPSSTRHSASLTVDGRHLLAGGFRLIPIGGGRTTSEPEVVLWDLEQGRAARSFKPRGEVGALACSPDGQTAALVAPTGDVTLLNLRTGAESARVASAPGALNERNEQVVAWSPEGARLATAGTDGQARVTWVSGPAAGTSVSLIGLEDQGRYDWIAVTREGYFVSSSNGADYVRWSQGARVSPVSLFRGKYERPDLVRRALRGLPIQGQGLDNEQLPPRARFAAPSPGQAPAAGKLTVSVSVQAWQPIDRVDLFVDGRPLPDELRARFAASGGVPDRIKQLEVALAQSSGDQERTLLAKALAEQRDLLTVPSAAPVPARPSSTAAPPPADGRDRYTFTVTLPVPAGNGPIALRAVAYDRAGLQSPPVSQLVPRTPGGSVTAGTPPLHRGRLFVLSVGITKYAEPKYNLNFAAADAESFAPALARAGRGHYREVKVLPALTDAAATQNGVEEYLRRPLAENPGPDDVVMVLLSAHGVTNGQGRYFFATHEVNLDDLPSTALAWEHLVERLQDLAAKAGRVYLFADTCQSAGVVGDQAADASRLAGDVRQRAGIVTFLSSEGYSPSYESDQYAGGHGAFTATLLEAFAGVGPNARLTVGSLAGHLAKRLPELTADRKEPQRPLLSVLEGSYSPDEVILLGGSPPPPAKTAGPPPAPADPTAGLPGANGIRTNLNGTWSSPLLGTIRLVHEGRRVYGTYGTGGQVGYLDGYVRDDEVRFWWWQKVSPGAPFPKAVPEDRGDGYFRVGADVNVLSGAWRFSTEFRAGGKPSRSWNARRAGPLSGTRPSRPAFAVPAGALAF